MDNAFVTAKQFILLNLGIVTLLVIYFMALRRRERPTRLHLSQPSSARQRSDNDVILSDTKSSATGNVRDVNLVFRYNNCHWDAYEVLGVPAGASFEDVQVAFNRLHTSAEKGSRAFYQQAYQAIKDQRKKTDEN